MQRLCLRIRVHRVQGIGFRQTLPSPQIAPVEVPAADGSNPAAMPCIISCVLASEVPWKSMRTCVLQCVATCCSVLQSGAVCCSVVPCGALCCICGKHTNVQEQGHMCLIMLVSEVPLTESAHLHTHAHTHSRKHSRTYSCICTHTHVYTRAHTYTRTHTHAHTHT